MAAQMMERTHDGGQRVAALARRFLLASAVLLSLAMPAGAVVLDGVVAIVDRHFVTMDSVMAQAAPAYAQLKNAYRGAELESKLTNAYTEAMQSQVDRYLVVDAYAKEENKIPDKALEGRVNEILAEKTKGDRAGFVTALQKEGVTLDEWQGEVRDRIIVTFMRGKMAEPRGYVSPKAMREAYGRNLAAYSEPEKIQVRMLRVAARREAEDLHRRLAGGEDFAELARQFSKDPKAAQGGDWGWIAPDDLRQELAQAAARLKPGSLSDVIEAGGDVYILKLEDRRAARTTPLSAVAADLQRKLKAQESDRLYSRWIGRLKERSFVQILTPDSGNE